MKLITRSASGSREVSPAEIRKQRLQAYWKLDDVVCRTFLQLGRKPDDFEAVKLFFPLIRERAKMVQPFLAEMLHNHFNRSSGTLPNQVSYTSTCHKATF